MPNFQDKINLNEKFMNFFLLKIHQIFMPNFQDKINLNEKFIFAFSPPTPQNPA